MRTTKRNGITPSDMDNILSSGNRLYASTEKYRRINNHKGDGMYTDNIRYMPQRRDFKKIEYMYNQEFHDILDKFKTQFPEYDVSMNHNKDDYDTYDIYITHYDRTLDGNVFCEDIEDIDDLMVCLEKKGRTSPFASTILDIFKSILDGRI